MHLVQQPSHILYMVDGMYLTVIHWISFVITDRSAKTVKLFHRERLAIHGITMSPKFV